LKTKDMKKSNATDRALEKYPVDIRLSYVSGMYGGPTQIDWNASNRTIYIQGYEQALKDATMEEDDVLLIRSLINARKSNKEIARIYNDRTNLDNPSEVVLFRGRSQKD